MGGSDRQGNNAQILQLDKTFNHIHQVQNHIILAQEPQELKYKTIFIMKLLLVLHKYFGLDL